MLNAQTVMMVKQYLLGEQKALAQQQVLLQIAKFMQMETTQMYNAKHAWMDLILVLLLIQQEQLILVVLALVPVIAFNVEQPQHQQHVQHVHLTENYQQQALALYVQQIALDVLLQIHVRLLNAILVMVYKEELLV